MPKRPVITVPTITLEGDANGAPHPEPSAYAKKFSGKYAHRTIKGGIGHNLPQEAPQAFAEAVDRGCRNLIGPGKAVAGVRRSTQSSEGSLTMRMSSARLLALVVLVLVVLLTVAEFGPALLSGN